MSEEIKMKALSASRIKTLENCAWLYWVQYHLRLPRFQNEGAKKGDVCHSVFEVLLNKKHNKHYKKVLKSDSVAGSRPIEKLVRKFMTRNELDPNNTEMFTQIDKMILVGLKTDFYVSGGEVVKPEYEFEIMNAGPKYYIKGFIDKPALRGDEVIIDDFKSSKKQFEGEDHESNVQALIYSLAAKKLWPTFKPSVRFIFLQFPDNPIQEIKFSEETLSGFELYLENIQEKVDNFSSQDATANFASDKGMPTTGEFKGKLICGFNKHAGQLKKDGTLMWGCPYKFAFDYYAIKKDGKVSYSVMDDKKVKLKAGEVMEKMRYDGCPRFNSVALNNMHTKIAPSPASFKNVLDDF